MTGPTSSRWKEVFAARYLATTVTLCLGVGLYAFNTFLVSTALPTAVVELGGLRLISWASTGFLIAAIVAGAAAASLKHRVGTRTALFGAAAVFLVGTLIVSFAGSMETILVGRVLQGIGEGLIAALCYTLIPDLFPSRLVPTVFGVEAIVWAVAAFGGPLVSGALTEALSWRIAFLFNIPLIVLFAALVPFVVGRSDAATEETSFPFLRLTACASGLVLLSIAGVVTSRWLVVVCILAALAILGGLIRVDRRSRDRLFPRNAFSLSSAGGAGLWPVLLMPVAQAASSVYLVLVAQRVLGYGPTLAGIFGAVMALSWSLFAVLVANVDRPATQRLLVYGGPLLVGAGMAGLVAAFALASAGLVLLSQVAVGGGFGVSWAFLSQAVMEQDTADERDRASALLPTLQSCGFAIGAAMAGLAANSAGLAVAVTPAETAVAAGWVFGMAALWGLLAFLFLVWSARLRTRQLKAAAVV